MQCNLELIGFNLDATRVDSAPDIAACMDHALQAVGLPPGWVMAWNLW